MLARCIIGLRPPLVGHAGAGAGERAAFAAAAPSPWRCRLATRGGGSTCGGTPDTGGAGAKAGAARPVRSPERRRQPAGARNLDEVPAWRHHRLQHRCFRSTPAPPLSIIGGVGADRLPSSSRQGQGQGQGRHLATSAAEKARRREAHERRVKRLASLPTRRASSPRDVLRSPFKTFFRRHETKVRRHVKSASRADKKWRHRVVAVVERHPVVLPDQPPWERDFLELKDYLDCFGKVYPPGTGFLPEEEDPDDPGADHRTEEELLAMLPEGLEPAPRITEADVNGDTATMDRKLDVRLFFTVRLPIEEAGLATNRSKGERADDGCVWAFPTTLVDGDEDGGETLLDAARRAVRDCAGDDEAMELYCPGNSPVAVDVRIYGDEGEGGDGDGDDAAGDEGEEEGYYGEKIFVYRVQRVDGDVDPDVVSGSCREYGWFDRDEVVERVERERGWDAARFHQYLL